MPSSADNKTIKVFLELLRAGLWEKEVRLSDYEDVDFDAVYQIADYQSVVGLVLAGIEHLKGSKVPQASTLTFIGTALQLEQRNKAMNSFIAELTGKMRKAGIYGLLVKGQGIAQCYERPQWRACGDVDLFLNEDNYAKAKNYLTLIASSVEEEERYKKHIGLTIDGWVVELHGNLYSSLSRKVERELEDVYADTFIRGVVRSVEIAGVPVFMLGNDNNVFYVFTHILQHYFHGGIGLRQICDWCRLLYTCKESLNYDFLEQRIKRAGLMSEWRTFAAFAVKYLGMPAEAVPFYEISPILEKKSQKVWNYIMKSGNFGHRDLGYVRDASYFVRKARSLKTVITEMLIHLETFPCDSIRFFLYYVAIRMNAVRHGE